MLDKMLRMGALFDAHSPMLTERQREMCELYYFNDYSLAEISELYGVSRQAVHDALTRAERTMEEHEEMFGLVRNAKQKHVRLNELDSRLCEASLWLKEAMSSLNEVKRSGVRQNSCELANVHEGIRQALSIMGSARQLVEAIDSGDGSGPNREDEDDEREGKP